MDQLNINIFLNGEKIEPQRAIEILQAIVGKKKPTKARPTLDQVVSYVRERGNKIDPHQFFDFYEANGWRQSKKAIKDWQACVRTWERNDYGHAYREKRTIEANNAHGEPDKKLRADSARRQLMHHFRIPEAADWSDDQCLKELHLQCQTVER